MLCLCECGQQKIVQLDKLRGDHTKSCGCLRRETARMIALAFGLPAAQVAARNAAPVIDVKHLNPGEVPLYGKNAAGRVALVDDGDYDLVMQYRWRVYERKQAGRRGLGPYAVTRITKDGRKVTLQMHVLIMGAKGIDHINHDGLNNRRSNLRPATVAQNTRNSRPRLGASSQYKGVHWATRDRRWRAAIKCDGKSKYLGTFWTERDAALAYDMAARELFGEYAVLNFPEIKAGTSRRITNTGRKVTRRSTSGRKSRSRRKEPLGYLWVQAALRRRQRQEADTDARATP